ncbi:hypothetical protein [Gordonia alkaliphila]|uniref:hypothetical protein n=1 Tax=Gordonia alkaliphila TaxID=1053547 RepID=UPI0027E2CA66|nr:hypothetical protein [Gordonia alkaliphila]
MAAVAAAGHAGPPVRSPALTGLAPRGRANPDWLGRLADAVTEPGQRWPPRTGVRLVSYRPDEDRRVAFTGSPGPTNPNLSGGATFSEALRASWAIPAWMPPVEIDGRTTWTAAPPPPPRWI